MDKIFELPTVGEILTQEFLEPLNITPYRLAKDLGVSTSTILDLVHGKRKIPIFMPSRILQKSFAWHKFSFAFILQKYIQRL